LDVDAPSFLDLLNISREKRLDSQFIDQLKSRIIMKFYLCAWILPLCTAFTPRLTTPLGVNRPSLTTVNSAVSIEQLTARPTVANPPVVAQRWRKSTKQVATLGPASSNREMIEKLFLAGADVFRLNFSHGSQEQKRELLQIIRDIEEKYSHPIAILGDLQGPKLRVSSRECVACESLLLIRHLTISTTTTNVFCASLTSCILARRILEPDRGSLGTGPKLSPRLRSSEGRPTSGAITPSRNHQG
jgi:Pyruvate kinase, barrel domain